MTRPGRPMGEVTTAALRALEQKAMPARELARTLQVPVPVAVDAARRLKDRGLVSVVGEAPADGRRPVDVYGISHAHVIALSWPRSW